MATFRHPLAGLSLAFSLVFLGGCARERLPGYPESALVAPSQAARWYPSAWPAAATPSSAWTPATGPFPDAPAESQACLRELDNLGLPYVTVSPKPGVLTPVSIKGPIGGVEYFSNGNGPFICDCRLALALASVAPEFVRRGVARVRYSGAYVYRLSRTGRLSLHAYGLAIDVHEVIAGQRAFNVARDYVRGMPSGCQADAPLLNSLTCGLERTRLFRELLTPDYNHDHHDHLHLAIAPLPAQAPDRARNAGG